MKAGTGGARAFLKVEGAGNDFVLLDDRGGPTDAPGRAAIRRVLDRHRGIGGDGLLQLHSVDGGVGVRFWNPDGGPAAFCGNGARCVALFLLSEGGEDEVEFAFGRHAIRAHWGDPAGARVVVRVPVPKVLPMPESKPPLPRPAARGSAWVDAGVPHWIVPVAGLEGFDLARFAPRIRAWEALGPGGTNVDAIEVSGRTVRVRTWERGVEGETLACGSGLTAAGFWAATGLGLGYPVTLVSLGGDRFTLGEHDRGLWLEGPARIVFRGEIRM